MSVAISTRGTEVGSFVPSNLVEKELGLVYQLGDVYIRRIMFNLFNSIILQHVPQYTHTHAHACIAVFMEGY